SSRALGSAVGRRPLNIVRDVPPLLRPEAARGEIVRGDLRPLRERLNELDDAVVLGGADLPPAPLAPVPVAIDGAAGRLGPLGRVDENVLQVPGALGRVLAGQADL